MSKVKETPVRTLLVALVLCLVCSVLVSGAALILRPLQLENSQVDRQRAVLAVAGLWEPGMSTNDVRRIFAERVSPRLVDLRTGQFSEDFDPLSFEQTRAARDPELSRALTEEEDIASIRRREHYAVVYRIEQGGQLQRLVLPVRGYGLWSTLHGFLALEPDLDTVAGIGFYQHAETPGLGGEVDNPNWQAKWVGKKVYADGQPALRIIKGTVDARSPDAEHQVDAIAGATLTGKGVTNLVRFWLGEEGIAPFLRKLAAGEA